MPIKKFLDKKAKELEQEIEEAHESEKKQEGGGDDEAIWLMSYADLMTLLCAFFIMLFAMSTINKPVYEKAKKEISEHFGGEYEKPNEELQERVTQIIDEAGLDQKVAVVSEASGVSIVFQSTIFFDTLSAYVKETGRKVLYQLIDAIGSKQKEVGKDYKIVVEGHTDARPILSGLYPSNWELSGARASRVLRMFIERGFKPVKLLAIGYGDTRPRFPNRTPAGVWDETALKKNRRVVVRIMDPGTNRIDFDPSVTLHGPPAPVKEFNADGTPTS